MPPLAGRIAGAGLGLAAVTITVLAALLYQDMSRETELSREVQAIQAVKDGLASLGDGLHRLRYALRGGSEPDFVAARIELEAELDYLRAKAAERGDVAPALAAMEPVVRDYVSQATLAAGQAAAGARALPLEEAETAAFRAVRAASARASAEVNRRTSERIQLWAGREVRVLALVAGTITVLIGIAVALRQSLVRARRDAARIEQLAHFDILTGLANRGLLDDRLARLVAQSRRNASPLAVLLFDLDGFKGVNDTLGHAAGDALLVAVAKRARACVRESDTVGRLGGDEFLVLLPDTDREGARAVAGKLLETLAAPCDLGAQSVGVSASIGGAFLPGPSPDAESLVREADEALYRSKRAGRNRYTEAAGPAADAGPD